MKKDNEFVQRIKECYVTTNCMQVMFYKEGKAISILDKDGIVYHQKDGSNFFVNKVKEKEKIIVFHILIFLIIKLEKANILIR